MIRATFSDGRISSTNLPYPGETIQVSTLGACVVEALSYCVKDNYVSLQVLESVIGSFRQTFPFTLKK